MKTIYSLLVLLYIGSICFSQDAEVEDSTSNAPDDPFNSDDSLDDLFPSILNLAQGENLTPEETGQALFNHDSGDEPRASSVDKKFFFWPWGWGWGWGGNGGCRKRICYSAGSYAIVPVCGYDVGLGYRSFRNSCFLNATNTCYQTNYALNHTGYC